MKPIALASIILAVISSGCNSNSNTVSKPTGTKPVPASSARSFDEDLQFLKQYHKDLVILGQDTNGARIIVAPAYQGRVMTSTAEGNRGLSFGWINTELISSGKPAPHMNAVGGEERFWLGPEGGQFSIFFKKGTAFTFDNWFVPKEIDTEPFDLKSSSPDSASFERVMHLENYSGTQFDLVARRTIRLLGRTAIETDLGLAIDPGIKAVGFESENSITNMGTRPWTRESGLLSIWILSMMNASPATTVIVPYTQGDTARLGRIVTDDYFGKVPGERLKVEPGYLLFKADAGYRSKIGLAPARARPLAGSFDSVNNVLTVAQFSLHPGVTGYVNSLWKIQAHPFSGDAVNAYNDGPIDGKQMGKFYEVESSSPAAALAPGKVMQHLHRIIHLKGNRADLDVVAQKLFGVGLDRIKL